MNNQDDQINQPGEEGPTPEHQMKRAARVTILVIDTFTDEKELRVSDLPFSLDDLYSLCHRCARDGIECDLPAELRSQYTVVACEVRDLAAPLVEAKESEVDED